MERGSIEFIVDEKLLARVMQRHMMRRLLSRPIRWLIVAFGIVFAIALVLAIDSGRTLNPLVVVLMLTIAAIYGLVWFWLAPSLARRQLRQSPALRAAQTVAWTDTDVSFASERGNMRMPMAEFHGWAEAGGALLLYQNEMLFHAIPLARLGDAAEDLRERLAAAGVRPI